MGSGPRQSNIKPTRSPLADGGPIQCPDKGRAKVTLLAGPPATRTGHVQLQDDQLLLNIGGAAVAVVHDADLKGCVEVGFEYHATLEFEDDPPTVRYRRD
jgi:hypothetical protein